MSHAVRHAFAEFKDPETLARAFKRLGWKIERNAKCRAWYQSKKYDFVAVNPNQGYDLAFWKTQDGVTIEGDLSMMDAKAWDSLGGKDYNNLKQAYTLESLADWSKVHNGSMTENRLANGVMEIEIDVEMSL